MKRSVGFAFLTLGALLAGGPLVAQSACPCPDGVYMGPDGKPVSGNVVNPAWATCACDYSGALGGPPPVNAVNPAWATCTCDALRVKALLDRPRNSYERAGMAAPRAYSLSESEYREWERLQAMRERESQQGAMRAASAPSVPSDPLEAVARALAEDPTTAGGSYRPRVEGGTLVLRGEVPTVWVHDHAVVLAATRAGLSVRDELRVTSLGAVPDPVIARQVQRRLEATGDAGASVEVSAGVVRVNPPVPDHRAEVLLQVPGVRAVQ